MVFLDYASTNPWPKYRCSDYYRPLFNVNANYAFAEKRMLNECEERVKKAIGAKGGKVVFGGTSSQLIENLMTAVNDANDIFHWEDNQYMTLGSYVEHDSFNRYIGHRCTDLKNLDEWLSYYSDIQTFVLWQAIQNITGEIFPTKKIGELTHKYNGFYICDGTAQIGHMPIESNIDDWCDFWCCSGHKAGTELGIGCCWVSDRLDKWLNGFKLHGTPNLAGTLAMTQAVEDVCDIINIECHNKHWIALYKYLDHGLIDNQVKFETVDAGGCGTHCAAINAIRLPGFNARALQSYLASKQVYVGLGQASCADDADRRILCNGYGLIKEEADEVIRVSFGINSSINEVKMLVEQIKNFKEVYL